MSAVARQHTLPGAPGMPGIGIADADDDALRECLAKDQEWLGKFLSDSSQDSNSERSQRVMQRTESRIAAIEEELARRVAAADARTERERADARAWLRGFLSGAPEASSRYHERAVEVADAWALIEPIARAVGLLSQSYRTSDSSLPAQHRRLLDSVSRAAQALGVTAPELVELDERLPSHEEVTRAVRIIRGEAAPPSESPLDGLGSVRVESLIARARG